MLRPESLNRGEKIREVGKLDEAERVFRAALLEVKELDLERRAHKVDG